jgi:hypothetical protein
MAPVRVSPIHDCGCEHDVGYSGASVSTTYSSRVIDEGYVSGGTIGYGGASYGVGPSDFELQHAMSVSRTGVRGGWNGGAQSGAGYTAYGGGYAVQGGGASYSSSVSVQSGASASSHVINSTTLGGRYVGGATAGGGMMHGGRR